MRLRKFAVLVSISFCLVLTALLVEQCLGLSTWRQKNIIVGRGYASTDNRKASALPPGGLAIQAVPQFITIGFDDNAFSGLKGSSCPGGVRFVLDLAKDKKNPAGKGNTRTYDSAPVHFSFYVVGEYLSSTQEDNPVFVRSAIHEAFASGHEIGNHTFSHDHGSHFAVSHWQDEINNCTKQMIKPFSSTDDPRPHGDKNGPGISASRIFGFRTPYLEYNDNVFTAIAALGFLYDCSIEEGFQKDQDGRNFLWPYTLDQASPGNAYTSEDTLVPLIGRHPGLWEMPCYAVIVPPDSKCLEYGVEPGLRAKLAKVKDYLDTADGKITGLDWNLWVDFQLSKAEFLATMKYTLDLRLSGNRCPLLFGTHSDIYTNCYPDTISNATPQERRDALAEFVSYALSKPEVRFAAMKEVLDWLRNPVALAP
jgi:hypothetical protein